MYITVETNDDDVIRLLQNYYKLIKYTPKRVRIIIPHNEKYEHVIELINILDPKSIISFV